MKYRRLGKRIDFDVSVLGFGCMRLPILDDDSTKIDEPKATEMLRHAVDAGVNYIDTAYPYHGGNSEKWLGRALTDGYAEKAKVATKLPTWEVKTTDDFDRLLNEQLQRLQTDRVDVYLLHNIHEVNWPVLRDLGVTDWLDRAVADGRIGHPGFSFHGEYPIFTEIIDAYAWHCCQVQYNYMNRKVQAGTAGVQYAAARGIGVIVMEPLLGGCLVDPPAEVQAIWDERPAVSPVDTALQWVWNQPEVATALSGMTTMDHVVENLASADRAEAGGMSEADLDRIDRVCQAYDNFHVIGCTRCGYCMPCPAGVQIPVNFQLYNDTILFGGTHKQLNQNLYNQMDNAATAAGCTGCRACEESCPQSIVISEELVKVREAFSK